LFVICCLVVLLSVALHGGSLMVLGRKGCPPRSVNLQRPPATVSAPSNDGHPDHDGDRIPVEELRRLQASDAPVLILDVRSEPSFASSELQAQGAVRVPPDQALRRIAEMNVPRETWIVAFCA
jgi:hypothetical protein